MVSFWSGFCLIFEKVVSAGYELFAGREVYLRQTFKGDWESTSRGGTKLMNGQE